MDLYEAEALIKQYNLDYQNQWEQTRFICFITAKSMGAKFNSPAELMRFAWEKQEEKAEKYTPEQLAAMKEEAIKNMNRFSEGKGTIVTFEDLNGIKTQS